MKTTFATLCALLLAAGSASAAVTVVNTASGVFDPGGAGSANDMGEDGAFSIGYQVTSPDSVLVATLYFDGGNGAATSLGFGTGAGDQAPDGLQSEVRSTMAYFLNPDASAGLALNGASGNFAVSNAGYNIWELAGVDLAAPVASTLEADGSTRITTTAADSFIVEALGFNPFAPIL